MIMCIVEVKQMKLEKFISMLILMLMLEIFPSMANEQNITSVKWSDKLDYENGVMYSSEGSFRAQYCYVDTGLPYELIYEDALHSINGYTKAAVDNNKITAVNVLTSKTFEYTAKTAIKHIMNVSEYFIVLTEKNEVLWLNSELKLIYQNKFEHAFQLSFAGAELFYSVKKTDDLECELYRISPTRKDKTYLGLFDFNKTYFDGNSVYVISTVAAFEVKGNKLIKTCDLNMDSDYCDEPFAANKTAVYFADGGTLYKKTNNKKAEKVYSHNKKITQLETDGKNVYFIDENYCLYKSNTEKKKFTKLRDNQVLDFKRVKGKILVTELSKKGYLMSMSKTHESKILSEGDFYCTLRSTDKVYYLDSKLTLHAYDISAKKELWKEKSELSRAEGMETLIPSLLALSDQYVFAFKSFTGCTVYNLKGEKVDSFWGMDMIRLQDSIVYKADNNDMYVRSLTDNSCKKIIKVNEDGSWTRTVDDITLNYKPCEEDKSLYDIDIISKRQGIESTSYANCSGWRWLDSQTGLFCIQDKDSCIFSFKTGKMITLKDTKYYSYDEMSSKLKVSEVSVNNKLTLFTDNNCYVYDLEKGLLTSQMVFDPNVMRVSKNLRYLIDYNNGNQTKVYDLINDVNVLGRRLSDGEYFESIELIDGEIRGLTNFNTAYYFDYEYFYNYEMK